MIGQQVILLQHFLHREVEITHQLYIVHVRPLLADLPVNLGQDRRPQSIPALPEVEYEQPAVLVRHQFRRHRLTHIADRSKRRHNKRQGAGNRLLLILVLPHGLHRQRILADRDGDAQLRTNLHADRLDRVEQAGILARMTGCRHPVGRQHDPGQVTGTGRRQVGQRLADRHAPGCRRIQQGQRCAFTHTHRLAAITFKISQGYGNVGDRYLPGPNHLVASDQATDATVTNRDQEGLVGHGRMLQYPVHRILQVDRRGIEWRLLDLLMLDIPVHARRFPKQDIQRHIHRAVSEHLVGNNQLLVGGGLAQNRVGTALTLAQANKILDALISYRQYITLLALIAPDLPG